MAGEGPEYLTKNAVGIIGCGHIGRTFAEQIIDHGFPRDALRVSYGGRASTLEKIKMAGLAQNISGNQEICRSSDITFISVRPQAFEDLKGLSFNDQSLVVSCMAGISRASLEKALGIEVHRIMPSGPDTIKEKKGIVAVYPHSDLLASVLSHMGMRVYELSDEEMMHFFTVGVCLPAALLVAGMKELSAGPAIDAIVEEYPDFREIYSWAKDVMPVLDSDLEREEYIRRMSTKGGITEAIVESLRSGSTFLDALRSGIARSREISVSMSR
ncbi:MAG TPA: NAD(P)-binding domain-containing protein [Methanotrichaceae archaeon]|nr:NAD(P)-binding domain-containing protein [Methanotrichaceae archaeon]